MIKVVDNGKARGIDELSTLTVCAAAAGDGLQVLQNIIDYLPSGVTLFDAELRMIACNERFKALLEFPDEMFTGGRFPPLQELAGFNAQRGDYGPGDPDELARMVIERATQMDAHVFERTRPNGTVLEIRGLPLPGGGFVTIYTDITERKKAEEEAKRMAAYLRCVIRSLPQGVSVINENLDLVLWNDAFSTVLGLPEGFVREGLVFNDVLRHNAQHGEYGPGDPEEQVRMRHELALRFEAHQFERTRRSGETLDVRGRPVVMDERTVGFVTSYTDITERKRAEEVVRRTHDLMADAIEHSSIYVWEIDAHERFTFVQGAEKVLGHAGEDIIGRKWRAFDMESEALPARCESLAARQRFANLVSRVRRKDGSLAWISSSGRPIFDEDGTFRGFRGVDVDVSEVTEARRALEHLAHHDQLTGLANRYKFLERFEIESERMARGAKPFSLLLVDIDHFKQVNDLNGHLAGDVCLKAVADLLQDGLRAVDLPARFGGEEFLVLLPETGIDGALVLAEKLRSNLEKQIITTDSGALTVTVSIGAAMALAGEAPKFQDLMARADSAVYEAKHSGRNRVCRSVADPEAAKPIQ